MIHTIADDDEGESRHKGRYLKSSTYSQINLSEDVFCNFFHESTYLSLPGSLQETKWQIVTIRK